MTVKHLMNFLHHQQTTILIRKKNNNNYDDDERLVLSQIFEDIFAQLDNAKHLIHPNSVLEENIDVTSIINSITNVISPSIIENQ